MTESETTAATAAPTEGGTDRVVLEDWTPLHRCLDFRVGIMSYQQRGTQVFTTQEVPNLINQGGLSAYRAAEVLYAHCQEVDATVGLERDIVCLELAMGLGLFSLQVLDRFQALCRDNGRDWYDRLTWYASDATPRMIDDARRNEVFQRHAGRVVLALVDAMDPARLVRADTGETIDLTGRVRGLFHTYVVSLLPANLFRCDTIRDGDGERDTWGVVMARTVLTHIEDLPLFTTLRADDIVRIAADPQADQGLLSPLYPLLDLELSLAQFDPAEISEGSELERVARALRAALGASAEAATTAKESTWVLHSGGALHSLGRQLEVIRPDGIILYRDYGPATPERVNGNHLYQHYGPTTATGINHFQVDTWLAAGDGVRAPAQVSAPSGEGEAPIKTRLVSRAALPATRAAFAERFAPQGFAQLEALIERARQEAQVEGAAPLESYRQALLLERDNWMLLGEAGDVALRRDRNLELAHVLLTEALRINPWYAANTWNSLGDLFWARGDWQQAELAYQRAVQANPEHHRGHLNLADCALRRGDWAAAVEHAARAVARDSEGLLADRALQAVQDAAQRLVTQRQRAARYRKERQAGTAR